MRIPSLQLTFLLAILVLIAGLSTVHSQSIYQPNTFIQNPPNGNYLANSSAFRQEIARVEINVVRRGGAELPITQVPRLEKDDVLKVRMLDEPVNGLKPDQSNYDWTFLAAFLNPGFNNDPERTVSKEIQFRKSGWYKEYSFVVPYDSQPIFFIYPKPNYRSKILNLITKNKDEIRKIGEKTIEISSAYAKIGSFLNELQSVLYRSQYYNGYGGYSGYGVYGGYGSNNNQNLFMEQAVERLARSFNIQMPTCWQNPGYGGYNNYGAYGNQYYGTGNDFAGRVQCIAKSVRLEDFDFSVSQMLQQGGILAATQLAQKYPQIAFWINIAAAALDFILQITKKTPLRLVPTIISTNENQTPSPAFQNSYGAANSSLYNSPSNAAVKSAPVKISLFAESSPNNSSFVTAYPLVVHKWQAEPDPEVLSLPAPVLAGPCLGAGQNVLRSTDLMNDWMEDAFTKDFKLVATSRDGFRREFALKKNAGLGGLELNLSPEDLNSFPKGNAVLEYEITGKRGFNEIRSPKFRIPMPAASDWEVAPQSQKALAAAGKRVITLKNRSGDCRCLQSVIYKPSSGAQTVYEADGKENPLTFSPDGKEVSFEVKTDLYQNGQALLELRQHNAEVTTLSINLSSPPVITDLKISRGDKEALVFGERLEQIKSVRINGRRASVTGNRVNSPGSYPNLYSTESSQANKLYNSASLTQARFVLDDPNARLDSDTVTLELELGDNRFYQESRTFAVAPSRPKIVSGETNEIEGTAANNADGSGNAATRDGAASGGKVKKAPIHSSKTSYFSIDSPEISLVVQNALTDHDFKPENIQIETRIENSPGAANALPKAEFKILDWKNIQIKWNLSAQFQSLLLGKRLQFRIRDKERGDSDWYTVKQTFLMK